MCLAIPGKILSVREDGGEEGEWALSRTGRVSFGGIIREVSLACVPEAGVGDYVIVHVGVAISKVDPEEAEEVFGYLQQLEEHEK